MGKYICKNILITLVFTLTTVLFFSAVAAAAVNKEKELFDKGYKYSISHQPEKAVETFKLFIKKFPESSSRDAAMYWLGKSLIQVKSDSEAKKVFSEIVKQFPQSPFIPHIEKELHALDTQSSVGKGDPNTDVKSLAENAVKAINELLLKLTETEKRASASEAALSQSVAEREKLQAQLVEEKKKLDAREAEVKNLSDNSGKAMNELQLKLTEAEKKASTSEAALSQSVAEREKLQAQLVEEKKKLDAREAEVKTLAENAVKAMNELQLKLAATAQKPSASGGKPPSP